MRRRKHPAQPTPPIPREAWGIIHPLLDLHGLTGDEARRRTDRWLRDRQAEGIRRVVVVTGRGLHTRGIPVLRNEVEHLLQELRGTIVVEWSPDHGGGSFRVELRRPPPEPPRPPVSPLLREADPLLRRRAEEALWELGIEPTPALVEAEIRRILREDGAV